jgi:hypothetical protein
VDVPGDEIEMVFDKACVGCALQIGLGLSDGIGKCRYPAASRGAKVEKGIGNSECHSCEVAESQALMFLANFESAEDETWPEK